jgi:hypothetical protein
VKSVLADETAEFLNHGTKIGEVEEIPVTSTGEVILTTLIGGASVVTVDCSGIFAGTPLPGGLGLINELSTLGGVAIPLTKLTGTGLDCEVLTSLLGVCGAVGGLAEVWAVNLPWVTVVLLMAIAPEFLVDVVSSGIGPPGYYVLCTNGKTNECVGKSSFKTENETGGVLGEFGEGAPIESEKATCIEGGNGAGDVSGSGLVASVGGSTIAVSE